MNIKDFSSEDIMKLAKIQRKIYMRNYRKQKAEEIAKTDAVRLMREHPEEVEMYFESKNN